MSEASPASNGSAASAVRDPVRHPEAFTMAAVITNDPSTLTPRMSAHSAASPVHTNSRTAVLHTIISTPWLASASGVRMAEAR